MRTLNIIILALVAFTATAQIQVNFKSSQELKAMADQVVSTNFVYSKEGNSDNPNYYVVSYKNNVGETLNVFFRINAETDYSFYGVTGQLNDLIPFWTKHINPQTNAEKISQSGEDKVVLNGYRFTLKNINTHWRLDCQPVRN